MTTPLEALAERLERDPFFLACPLHWFAASETLSDEALADYLGCTRETLVKLRLCRTPQERPPAFGRGVAVIAQRLGVKEAALAKAVRRGLTILKLQESTNPSLAARDRPSNDGSAEDAP